MQEPAQSYALALLAWYRDMGVSDALAAEPASWLDRRDDPPLAQPPTLAPIPADSAREWMQGPAPRSTAHETRPAQRGFNPMPPAAAEEAARTDAASAESLEALRSRLERFEGCALKATAKNLCFYRGAPRARLMVIGEAPGREEDLEGKPFVGRAGQLLDRMLAAIGLGEPDVHITNIVYWRPPGNRTPTPQEALVCRPFLTRQIELVRPDVLLLLGGAAAKQVLDVTDGILRLRGTWRDITVGERKIPVMATLHPAYLLRTPASKRLAWRDLRAVRARLDAGRDAGPRKSA